MTSFELVYITRPELDDEANAALLERISSLIAGQGGTVEGVDKLGKRRLAYEIDGKREGTYTILRFRSGPRVPAEVERVLRISDEVIRHLLVRFEAPTPAATRPRVGKPGEPAASAEPAADAPAQAQAETEPETVQAEV